MCEQVPQRLRAWAGVAAMLSLLALSACDGYPTHDAPPIRPFDMTQPERVAALNDIGAQPRTNGRWRYALAHGCILEIGVRQNGKPAQAFSVPLLWGWDVALRRDTPQDAYAVQLLPASTPESAPLAVLESGRRIDALIVHSLLRAMQIDCQNEAAAAGAVPATNSLPS